MARLCCDRSRVRRDRDGVDRLERVLLEQLPEGDPIFPDDYLTDQPERALAAEMVREKHWRTREPSAAVFTPVAVDGVRRVGTRTAAAHLLHDLGRAGVQKPIVIGRRRRDDQAHRHRGAAGSRTVLRDEGIPISAQGECRLAEQRADARRARRAETDREA